MDDRQQPREAPEDPTIGEPVPLNESFTASSTWRPLRLPLFRNILIAGFVSDIGAFMQGVGAAWLMASKGAGPLLVALTQTASALPFFLLALPAGAVGDIFDRRKVILTIELFTSSVARIPLRRSKISPTALPFFLLAQPAGAVGD